MAINYSNIKDLLKTPIPHFPEFLERPIKLNGKNSPTLLGFTVTEKSPEVKNPNQASKKHIIPPNNGTAKKDFYLDGILHYGQSTTYGLCGKDLILTSNTWIFGDLKLGQHAKAKGLIVGGSERVCTSLIIE